MISQKSNRVQAIKSKFENLNTDSGCIVTKPIELRQLIKQEERNIKNSLQTDVNNEENDSDLPDLSPKPNNSYLYSKIDAKKTLSEPKKALSRQISDPGKKLQRSHAFRCDKTQKINNSPKRHGSCNSRPEVTVSPPKMGERVLSKEKLKRLGNLLETQMKKENFVAPSRNVVGEVVEVPVNSIPDKDVPKHILDQYAKVLKPKKVEEKQDVTDSGVSSETENLEEDKNKDKENKDDKIKKLVSHFEKPEPLSVPSVTNLEVMNDLCVSSETMRLERKNPHLILTDTLKKALKQPLPSGPPPKKPPRAFASPIPESPEKQKKDPKKMLEKLEQVLNQRESQKKNIYDVAETNLSVKKPKEVHYLCTEILDIAQRTLLPNQTASESLSNCFNSLNCVVLTNSTASLPYTRLSSRPNSSLEPLQNCSCHMNSSEDNSKQFSTFLGDKSMNKCSKCLSNDEKEDRFKCHLNCKCKLHNSEFYVDNEHIYDEPFTDESQNERKNRYGTLNSTKSNRSRSLENLQTKIEDETIYDIPSDVSRADSPVFTTSSPKSEFQKLLDNFEKGCADTENRYSKIDTETNTQKIGIKSLDAKFGADLPEIRKFGTEISGNRSLTQDDTRKSVEKPLPLTPKPDLFAKNVSKSTENIAEDFRTAKRLVEKKFGTDTRMRYRNRSDTNSSVLSMPRKSYTQLDVDRENLNRLMNEIYDTVAVACSMEDKKLASFPTDTDGSTSEESVKLTRSLTEKRKNYVRRVSSRVAYLDNTNINRATRFRHQTSVCSYKSDITHKEDNPYNTFRSWKSFRTSRSNLTRDNKMADSTDSKFNLTDSSGNILSMKDEFENSSIDEKTGCLDISLPFEPRERGLFNVCLLVGLNYMTGQAYVKSVFPNQVQLPPHLENLIFPETMSAVSSGEWTAEAKIAQCYSLVLTDERGERSYGYCRRVLPEGASVCLPLCYCVIGKYRAPGFYFKVLQEIESHHGSSETEIHSVLKQLFDSDFPEPGEEISISYQNSSLISDRDRSDSSKCKTMPNMREKQFGSERELESENRDRESCKSLDFENNNGPDIINLTMEMTRRTKVIKRPIEPRVDEDCLSVMLDTLGAGLVIKVFSSLLLERKVIIIGDDLSAVSGSLCALQGALYPLVWQQPLVCSVPAGMLRDLLGAPLPMLAGALTRDPDIAGLTFEEGMLIDLSQPSKVQIYQGDESTILPTSSYKSLKTSLQMETNKHRDRSEDTRTRNLMISEAFLRFFIDILGDFRKFFVSGQPKDGDLGKGNVIFDKASYIHSSQSKQNQYFLEWFTETAMFNHFILNMCARHHLNADCDEKITKLVDTPTPNFYQLLDERLATRTSGIQKSIDKVNYKNAVNRKVKLLKAKLKDLIS